MYHLSANTGTGTKMYLVTQLYRAVDSANNQMFAMESPIPGEDMLVTQVDLVVNSAELIPIPTLKSICPYMVAAEGSTQPRNAPLPMFAAVMGGIAKSTPHAQELPSQRMYFAVHWGHTTHVPVDVFDKHVPLTTLHERPPQWA